MIINRTHGGHILRIAFGILALIIVIAVYTGMVSAQPTPGWYRNGAGTILYENNTGLKITWQNSYIYPHPGEDNLYWYAEVIYSNNGSQSQKLTCNGWSDPSLAKENMRGTANAGIVAAEETFCNRNPNFTRSLNPGETHKSWAIFHNVPNGGEVSLEWSSYGSSLWVDPWYSPFSAPPPAECPPKLVTRGTCKPTLTPTPTPTPSVTPTPTPAATPPTVSITANPDTHDINVSTNFTFTANPVGSWGNNISYSWSVAYKKCSTAAVVITGKSISEYLDVGCGNAIITVTASDEKNNTANDTYLVMVHKEAAPMPTPTPTPTVNKQVIGPEGGIVYGPGGVGNISVIIPQGALQKSTPVSIFIDNLAWEAAVPPPDEGIMVGVANLDIGGAETAVPMDIDMPAPDGITNEDQVLVVEVVNYNGAVKYQVVDIAKLINDRLVSQIITDPFSFPQIVKGGIFGFFIAKKDIEQKAEVGFVKGVVKGVDGKPISGAVVTISNLPLFVSKTNAKGEYLVPSIVGSFSVTAFDPNTGNFKTVSSAVPNKGGGVIVDIHLTQDSLPLNNGLTNRGFESDLSNWTDEGQVLIMPSLESLTPQEGGKMVLLTTGALSVNHTFSTLKQKFTLPSGAKKLSFKYDFISREYPDYIGSKFNDQFEANLLTKR